MSEAEVIDGTAVEIERAVVPSGMSATGALALAGLTDDEFDRRLAALEKGRDRVARIQRALMVPDVDFGIIPGTGTKPTLLKPGAEKLCQAYGLAADFTLDRIVGDGEREPHLSYVVRCELHLGATDGPVVAIGHGSANSWERKHRYRQGQRLCPSCGLPAIIKGKAEYGGGWVCFKKRGGCGSKWPEGAPEVEGQSVGDIENPDPFDLDVVLCKMAEKRAYIDATLRATAASGLFTQDIEDLTREMPHDAPERPETPAAASSGAERHDGLVGTVARGRPPVDMELRQTPDGVAWGFKVTEGRRGYQALATGALAEALATAGLAEGQRVHVWGAVVMVPWQKDGKDMPPYARIELERVATDEWTLPAQEAPSEPMFRLDPDEAALVGGGLP